MPAFNIEFHKPHVVHPRGVTCSILLDRIIALNAVQRIRRGDDPAAILVLNRQQDEFLGEAARIRMEDLPSIIDTATGNRHELNVEVQEGVSRQNVIRRRKRSGPSLLTWNTHL